VAAAALRPGPTPSAPVGAAYPAGPSAPAAQPAVQIAVQIAAAVPRGVERLWVQLEPPALGRVEVRLEFSRDNRVSALIAADRQDTLDFLQRDSRALERALQDAGLRLTDNGLSFSLRQEQRQHGRDAGAAYAPLTRDPAAGAADLTPPSDVAQPRRWLGVHRVLDIRI
jgi:flagellar hook-length control protein FliK